MADLLLQNIQTPPGAGQVLRQVDLHLADKNTLLPTAA